MIKAIDKVAVNDEQLAILRDVQSKQMKAMKEVHSDIFPQIVGTLKQIRELTSNIALIAGAIATFTIPVVNTSFIQIKLLAYLAIVLLFATIGYAIYHLSEVLSKELNELARQHNTYTDIFNEAIDKVTDVIESGDISKLEETNSQSVLERLTTLKTTPEIDKSLTRLRTMLTLALILLTLSFIPSSILCTVFSFWSGLIISRH